MGAFRIAWEERGTKNHIKAFIWLIIELLKEGVIELTLKDIIAAPITVTINANSFISKDKIGSL